MITTYRYPQDKDRQLSKHFKMGEFVSDSDYTDGNYPLEVPIHSMLPETLEKVYEHFGCTLGIINSGYRSPSCDISVGGSGSGPHTLGIAVDAYFYKDGAPVPSRLVACYLQDIGIKGIGLNCGGNPNGTHFDLRGYGIWEGSVWFGDEARRSGGIYATCEDFYSYTGTKKSEVGSDDETQESAPAVVSVNTTKRTLSDEMLAIIKNYEGLSLRAYRLSGEEHYTIGYGHYGSDVGASQVITEAEATELLRKDVKIFEDAVNSAVKAEITQKQFDALVSLAYNIGVGAVADSDTMAYLNKGMPGHAAVDIPSWRKGMGGQILPGLEKRRQTELEFFAVGEDFTITDCMNVRAGPGTNQAVKKVSQLSANGRKCAVDKNASADAVFREGTEITCLEVKAVYSASRVDVWMRCPSGWICARMGDDVFVE